jgi:hypothetical protein
MLGKGGGAGSEHQIKLADTPMEPQKEKHYAYSKLSP